MNDSKEYYSKLAIEYSGVSKKREQYLNKIDGLVKNFAPKNTEKYLDVGAGDGRRSLLIAKMVEAEVVVLLDNCEEITYTLEGVDNIELVISNIAEYKTNNKFNLITCLWNVLGHVGNEKDKLNFLLNISELLDDDGVFITDVNNRYNAANYGTKVALKNMFKDFMKSKDTGWFSLGVKENQTRVYIHNPFELEKLASHAGLKVKAKQIVNYQTGKLENSWWKGQLFYVFTKE